MILHDFQAACPNQHLRNFVWESDSEDRFSEVKSRCVYCSREVLFKVVKYHQPPCDEKEFKI